MRRAVALRWMLMWASTMAVALGAGVLYLAALEAGVASAETCPNEAVRRGLSANLPDCRAYELVTPPFKEAAEARIHPYFHLPGFSGMSTDGSRVDVTSLGDFGNAESGYDANSYQLTRTPSGWSEQSIDLPASQFPASRPLDSTPELGAVLYEAQATGQSLYAKDLWLREADGTLRDLGPFEPPADTLGPPIIGGEEGVVQNPYYGEFITASANLSQAVFDSPTPWKEEGAGGNLYEYTAGHNGPPALVSVEPGGSPCEAEGKGLEYAGAKPIVNISADGSTMFFRCAGQVLARVDGSQTVAISEPSAEDCSACETYAGDPAKRSTAYIVGAPTNESESYPFAEDGGSKVFFATAQPLLGPATETSTNLYEYDFDAPRASAADPDGRIVDVTAGDWGAEGARVHPEDVVVSEDGSHAYFVAEGTLNDVTNSQGKAPTEGGENLYVFDSETGVTSFIATLAGSGDLHGGCEAEARCPATVTPDGLFLAFTTSADITPDDTSTAQQVFRYDAGTASQPPTLVRVSIGQDGFNDDGNTDTFNAETQGQAPHMPLAMSDNGEYIVFQSADGLTPGALNGYVGQVEFTRPEESEKVKATYDANNVYEYHDGNVYLISDGQDTSQVEERSAVEVEGVSPEGNDVFFTTADQLVPQDLDTEIDLYDARLGGGFPASASLLPSCSGDGCQGQLSPAPPLLSPGSEFQAGSTPSPAVSESAPDAKPRALTRAQKLANALRACRKERSKKKRAGCDASARRKYSATKAKNASNERRARS